jgi:hypothetical protein
MTYTINAKQYTEFDINVRCAKLMGHNVSKFSSRELNFVLVGNDESQRSTKVNYTYNPSDTDAIIDKCWDELMEVWMNEDGTTYTTWDFTIEKHNCTKLVAACICLIELNE